MQRTPPCNIWVWRSRQVCPGTPRSQQYSYSLRVSSNPDHSTAPYQPQRGRATQTPQTTLARQPSLTAIEPQPHRNSSETRPDASQSNRTSSPRSTSNVSTSRVHKPPDVSRGQILEVQGSAPGPSSKHKPLALCLPRPADRPPVMRLNCTHNWTRSASRLES